MTQVREAYRWRTSDLDPLPDTPWLRYEIISGELIVSRRPHLQHSEIILTLGSFLRPIVRALGGKVLAEPGIVWGEEAEDNVVPDIAVVLPDRLQLAKGPAISGATNIAIEVVSESSRTTDYVQKRYLYERTGAQEYWIIDWQRQLVEVWTFTEPAARVITYGVGQTITTPLVPGVSASVEELLG